MTAKRRGPAQTVRRGIILEALLRASTMSEAARLAGISRKALYARLQTDEELLTAFRDLRRGQVRDLADRLAGGAEKAVEALGRILDDPTAPAAVKVQAAGKVLETLGTFRGFELESTKAALAELEQKDGLGFRLGPGPSAV